MSLEDYFESFIMANRNKRADGMGGEEWTWMEGSEFQAGISTNNTSEAQIAYQAGSRTIFRIVTRKDVILEQKNMIKRVKDGRLYRITSNAWDMETPDAAEVQFWQVNAEVVEV